MGLLTLAAVECHLMALERKGMIASGAAQLADWHCSAVRDGNGSWLAYVTLPAGVEYYTLRGGCRLRWSGIWCDDSGGVYPLDIH